MAASWSRAADLATQKNLVEAGAQDKIDPLRTGVVMAGGAATGAATSILHKGETAKSERLGITPDGVPKQQTPTPEGTPKQEQPLGVRGEEPAPEAQAPGPKEAPTPSTFVSEEVSTQVSPEASATKSTKWEPIDLDKSDKTVSLQ